MEDHQLMNGQLTARVRVLAVLAADRYSVALLDQSGHRVKGDLTLRLAEHASPYILRPAEPPLVVAGLYNTDADGNAPAACPDARDRAETILRTPGAAIFATIPITGAGWLRSILQGDAVIGDLAIQLPGAPSPRPIADLLAGHLIDRPIAQRLHLTTTDRGPL
jgi:hypothetical protein